MLQKFVQCVKDLFPSKYSPTVSERYTINESIDVQPRSMKHWSDNELLELVENWQNDYSIEYLAKYLGRTVPSIRRKLNDLGYSIKRDAPRVPTLNTVTAVEIPKPIEEVPTVSKPVTLTGSF